MGKGNSSKLNETHRFLTVLTGLSGVGDEELRGSGATNDTPSGVYCFYIVLQTELISAFIIIELCSTGD